MARSAGEEFHRPCGLAYVVAAGQCVGRSIAGVRRYVLSPHLSAGVTFSTRLMHATYRGHTR